MTGESIVANLKQKYATSKKDNLMRSTMERAEYFNMTRYSMKE